VDKGITKLVKTKTNGNGMVALKEKLKKTKIEYKDLEQRRIRPYQ